MLPHNRYVDFFTDFAFKRLFGSEVSKPILLDFLNELLYQEQGRIVSLTYLSNEQMGRNEYDRKAVYDLYCENERGEKFIVEIQRAKHEYFKDRILFYSTFPIIEQAPKSAAWDFALTPVYIVAILDFVFDDDKADPSKYRYDIKLADVDTGKVFYDKLTFIYLAMPKFTKTEAELSNRFEKWLYVLKNLHHLDRIPEAAREAVFQQFFHLAEIAKFSREERSSYDTGRKVMWDNYAAMEFALKEAKAEGREQGMTEGLVEGEAKGKAEGLAEGLCAAILSSLAYRFGHIPPSLSEKLSHIHDANALHTLMPKTFTVVTLADFEVLVDALTGETR